MERKLASIRKVKSVSPIDGADFIELVKIDGWQCVVKKEDFSTGDLGVYFEIDSFLPIEDRYEFLRKSCLKTMPIDIEGFRLRTIKLRGQLSQGLLLPLSEFTEISNPEVGQDVTELLKVQLYEPPIPAEISGEVKGSLPYLIPKTDEERIQNLPEYFELYKDVEFEETEKIDGTSCTVYHNQKEFGICGKNWEYKENDKNSFWKKSRELNLQESLLQLNKNIALQGEFAGEGIQSNRLKLKGHHFFIFNIYDIDNHRYILHNERLEIITSLKNKGIEHVPVLSIKKIFEQCKNIDDLLEYVDSDSNICENFPKEGSVFKSTSYFDNKMISFKAISNKYLIKYGL